MSTPSDEPAGRTVVANISVSLDGRVNGPGGDYDMSWIVPHALTDGAREHMVKVTNPASTALLGRKNYQGFASYWPAVADNPDADPRDRAFAQWLNAVDKVVFSTTLQEAGWPNSRIVADDPAAEVRRLRKQGEATSSSSPAPASSATCWRPAKWTGSASRYARHSPAAAPGCSAMTCPARPGHWQKPRPPIAARSACSMTGSGPRSGARSRACGSGGIQSRRRGPRRSAMAASFDIGILEAVCPRFWCSTGCTLTNGHPIR